MRYTRLMVKDYILLYVFYQYFTKNEAPIVVDKSLIGRKM